MRHNIQFLMIDMKPKQQLFVMLFTYMPMKITLLSHYELYLARSIYTQKFFFKTLSSLLGAPHQLFQCMSNKHAVDRCNQQIC